MRALALILLPAVPLTYVFVADWWEDYKTRREITRSRNAVKLKRLERELLDNDNEGSYP